MKALLIGYMLKSLIISEHADMEACLGRLAVLKEKGAVVKCVDAPAEISGFTATGRILLSPGGYVREAQ